jgi:hypothetical protein
VQRRIVDRFSVFSQRIAGHAAARAAVEDDPEFDLDRHLSTAVLPEPAGEAEPGVRRVGDACAPTGRTC